MPLPTAPVLGILADNLRLRGSVLPLAEKKLVGWADGLDLPRGGSTVLYTGHVYQLMPAIAALEGQMLRFEDSWLNRFAGVGRSVNRMMNISGLMAHESRKERAVYDGRLAKIVRLLRTTGVEFGYLYEEELYSGALVHDEGLDEIFAAHAEKVAEVLKRREVKSVITVDPHTTNILRSVFPEVLPGFDLEVKSYLEVLAEAAPEPVRDLDLDLTIHDSCVYARGENIVEEPRVLLERGGARIHEPASSRRRTLCCGGPIESLYPSRAQAICRRRLDELARAASLAVAMCPICLLNLERNRGDRNLEVKDVCEVLTEAYCPEP
jgi:Cysteine-rich domain